jgi:hypothetical protein
VHGTKCDPSSGDYGGRSNQPAQRGAVDDPQTSDNRRLRDRKNQVRDDETKANGPGPRAVALEHRDRFVHILDRRAPPAQDGIADIAMQTEAKRDFTTTLRQACSVVPGGRTLGALGPFR